MMCCYKILPLLLVLGGALSDGKSQFRPCSYKDIECSKLQSDVFLQMTKDGLPKHGVVSINPVFLSMVCVQSAKDVMLHFKNVTVAGLESSKMEDFNLDPTTKLVKLNTKSDITIAATLVVELTDVSKTFSGQYTGKASIKAITKYNYEIVPPEEDAAKFFEIGPETITVEPVNQPEVTLSSDLLDALENGLKTFVVIHYTFIAQYRVYCHDVDAKSKREEYYANLDERRRVAFSKVAEEAVSVLVQNLRTMAKLLPKSAFYTDV